MNKHLKYLKYVIKHKWYVFQECAKYSWKYDKPTLFWRGIIHDWQKFTPTEWFPYVETFYGPYEYDERPEWLVNKFDYAWLHHQHYGPHHYQYYILREDSGDVKILGMMPNYILEMVADWKGASRAITGADNSKDWYLKNKDKIILNKYTREKVETLLGV